MAGENNELLEILLRECQAASPQPWYPSEYAQQTGVVRATIEADLDRLRLAGLLRLSDWVKGKGQGYLLTVLAAIFIGGTPTWGGVGTIAGAICGACTVAFIETGLIAAGLSGFWTNLFYGLVVVLSLVLHRFNRPPGSRGV